MTGQTLRVSGAALRAEASWCESLAAKLAGNTTPTGAVSSALASAAAVTNLNGMVAVAGAHCVARIQATATKLAADSPAAARRPGYLPDRADHPPVSGEDHDENPLP